MIVREVKTHETERRLQWLLLIIGIIFTTAGLITNWDYSLQIFFVGVILLSTDFLASLIIGIPSTFSGIEYTPSGKENWKKATELINKMDSDYRGYDISSYKNDPDFEAVFLRKCEQGCTFSRVIACDADKDIKTKEWLK